jgi:hypothetical protein
MGVVMERWCPTQPVLGVLLMSNKIAAIIITAFLLIIYAMKQEDATPKSPPPSDAYLACFNDQRDLFDKSAISAARFCDRVVGQ